MNDGGTWNSRGMNTGFGAQSNPDHTETPRSCQRQMQSQEDDGGHTVTGQIMYLNLVRM
jgi:hypothetical protein